jgi:hypothetical protein
VLDERRDGMTDKFGGPILEYIFDGPIDDNKVFLEKILQRKREKADRK